MPYSKAQTARWATKNLLFGTVHGTSRSKMKDRLPWYRASHRAWFVCFQGKQIRLHADKEEAWRKWHRLEAGLDQPPAQGPMLSALIDAYLADAEQRLKPVSMEARRKVLGRLATDKGDIPAERFDADALLEWLRTTAWGQSTRWLAASIVRTMMLWAVRRKMLEANPVEGIKVKSPVSRGSETVISPEVHAQILAVAPAGTREILTALWETGCRPGEACKVEARHFDAAAGCWRLDEHKTDKSGRQRIVYLSPVMIDLCRRLAAEHPSGPLFRNSNGEPFSRAYLANWLHRVRKRLGLGKVILYGYRHSFATNALANGVPDAAVAELLGHAGTAMLHKHYSHLGARADALRAALSRVRGA